MGQLLYAEPPDRENTTKLNHKCNDIWGTVPPQWPFRCQWSIHQLVDQPHTHPLVLAGSQNGASMGSWCHYVGKLTIYMFPFHEKEPLPCIKEHADNSLWGS